MNTDAHEAAKILILSSFSGIRSYTNHPARTAMIDMLRMLRPRATMPPSPKSRHWIMRIVVMITTAVTGPRMIAASAAPMR